jgi:hypothetical protein
VTWVGVAGFEPAASSSRTSGAAGRLVVVPARLVCGWSCWLATVRGRCCTLLLYAEARMVFKIASRLAGAAALTCSED